MPQPTTLSGFLIVTGLLLVLIGGKFFIVSGIRVSDIHWKRIVVIGLGLLCIAGGGSISYHIWDLNRKSTLLTPGHDCGAPRIPEPLFEHPHLKPNPDVSPND